MSDLRHTDGRWMAYQGREDCTSVLCRRMPRVSATGNIVKAWVTGDCIGWHCAVCDKPSSQYGHNTCHEEASDV